MRQLLLVRHDSFARFVNSTDCFDYHFFVTLKTKGVLN